MFTLNFKTIFKIEPLSLFVQAVNFNRISSHTRIDIPQILESLYQCNFPKSPIMIFYMNDHLREQKHWYRVMRQLPGKRLWQVLFTYITGGNREKGADRMLSIRKGHGTRQQHCTADSCLHMLRCLSLNVII